MENNRKKILCNESRRDIRNLFLVLLSITVFMLVIGLVGSLESGPFIIVMIISVLVYLLPSFIAAKRKHRSGMAIVALNIILGWTFLGWVGALIWSLTGNVENKNDNIKQV